MSIDYGHRLAAMPHIDTPRFDCHVHTEASFDCEADVMAVCEAAVAAGLAGIAITDHVEMVDFERDGMDVAAERSWELAERARAAYMGRLTVLRGIELGEPLYDPARAETVLARHPYDFVLASVHRLGDEPDYYFLDAAGWTPREVDAMLRRYFDEVRRTVEWGRFDVLAHLTYPVRYLPAALRPADYTPWAAQVDAILSALAARGLGLERNTAGLRGGEREPSPPEALIERFRALGGAPVTWGSDAHTAAEVGRQIRIMKVLQQKGQCDTLIP